MKKTKPIRHLTTTTMRSSRKEAQRARKMRKRSNPAPTQATHPQIYGVTNAAIYLAEVLTRLYPNRKRKTYARASVKYHVYIARDLCWDFKEAGRVFFYQSTLDRFAEHLKPSHRPPNHSDPPKPAFAHSQPTA